MQEKCLALIENYNSNVLFQTVIRNTGSRPIIKANLYLGGWPLQNTECRWLLRIFMLLTLPRDRHTWSIILDIRWKILARVKLLCLIRFISFFFIKFIFVFYFSTLNFLFQSIFRKSQTSESPSKQNSMDICLQPSTPFLSTSK